jgi:hypothetical protein
VWYIDAMTRRSPFSPDEALKSKTNDRSFAKGKRPSLVPIELEDDLDTPKGVWCIIATVIESHETTPRAGSFDPGTKVYCFPPMRGGAFESVEVIGPHRKNGKLMASVIAATDLTDWKAVNITDPEVLQHISPPWDNSHVSRNVAEGIVAWKSGGPWPIKELRIWNRSRAEKVVGEGSLLARVRGKFMSLFGKE